MHPALAHAATFGTAQGVLPEGRPLAGCGASSTAGNRSNSWVGTWKLRAITQRQLSPHCSSARSMFAVSAQPEQEIS